jgi:hypothetical protein
MDLGATRLDDSHAIILVGRPFRLTFSQSHGIRTHTLETWFVRHVVPFPASRTGLQKGAWDHTYASWSQNALLRAPDNALFSENIVETIAQIAEFWISHIFLLDRQRNSFLLSRRNSDS